jgi:hypothetical protein
MIWNLKKKIGRPVPIISVYDYESIRPYDRSLNLMLIIMNIAKILLYA